MDSKPTPPTPRITQGPGQDSRRGLLADEDQPVLVLSSVWKCWPSCPRLLSCSEFSVPARPPWVSASTSGSGETAPSSSTATGECERTQIEVFIQVVQANFLSKVRPKASYIFALYKQYHFLITILNGCVFTTQFYVQTNGRVFKIFISWFNVLSSKLRCY